MKKTQAELTSNVCMAYLYSLETINNSIGSKCDSKNKSPHTICARLPFPHHSLLAEVHKIFELLLFCLLFDCFSDVAQKSDRIAFNIFISITLRSISDVQENKTKPNCISSRAHNSSICKALIDIVFVLCSSTMKWSLSIAYIRE